MNGSGYVSVWFMAFTLTLLIEVPIYYILGRRHTKWWRALLGGGLATCFSHPLLVFVWAPLFRDFRTYAVTGELLVFVFEALFFWIAARPIPLKYAVLTAFAANGASCLAGFILFDY